MLLNLPEGAKEAEVPEKLKKLISDKYPVEAIMNKDGELIISIIKMRNVSYRFDNADLLMSDDQLKDRILNPMINALEESYKNVA